MWEVFFENVARMGFRWFGYWGWQVFKWWGGGGQ